MIKKTLVAGALALAASSAMAADARVAGSSSSVYRSCNSTYAEASVTFAF